jgi:hypothetical protein
MGVPARPDVQSSVPRGVIVEGRFEKVRLRPLRRFGVYRREGSIGVSSDGLTISGRHVLPAPIRLAIGIPLCALTLVVGYGVVEYLLLKAETLFVPWSAVDGFVTDGQQSRIAFTFQGTKETSPVVFRSAQAQWLYATMQQYVPGRAWGTEIRSSADVRLPRRSDSARLDLFLDAIPDAVVFHIQVVLCLKVQPKPLGGPEVASQSQRRICRDCPRAVHDLVDPARRNIDVLGQAILADPQGRQELLEQDLPGMDGRESLGHHLLLVVVHDLNVVRIAAVPPEADPPLIVDPDAVLTCAITAQPFQAVPRRHAKIVQPRRSIKHPELPQGHLLHPRSEPANRPTVEELLGFPVSEALDHGVS